MAIFPRLSKHEPANTIALGRQIAEETVSAGRNCKGNLERSSKGNFEGNGQGKG
jgi:hypothetical protein